MLTALRACQLRNHGSIPCCGRDFCPLQSAQTGSESTSPPIQWALRTLSAAAKRPGREADHSEIFVSRSRMSGIMRPRPNMLSGRAQDQFAFI